MKTIQVSASHSYQVLIEYGLLSKAGELISSVSRANTAVIISGEHVFPLYGTELENALERAGVRVLHWLHPSGEENKNLETYGKLLSFLSENQIGRGDLLLSLGGGVTGDLCGFAAATYQRGIGHIQIPTSLLAMVDSSVGGKNALNLPSGKNQVGCVYQPRLVLCDPALLETLPERERRCGWAEVIKYAVLSGPELFHALEASPAGNDLEHVIERCVAIKRDYVAADEFDRGCRRLLNLGHSFGHAVEACSGYALSHGEAVSIGMAMVTRAAVARGICKQETLDSLLTLLRQYELPTETEIPNDMLRHAMLADKKREGGILHLVVPEAVGRCSLVPVPVDRLSEWLRQGGAR